MRVLSWVINLGHLMYRVQASGFMILFGENSMMMVIC